MSNNSYNDFKNGIKTDIKETGASLFLVGGLILLVCILVATALFAIKSKSTDTPIRYMLGGGVGIIALLLIFSPSARGRIAQIWLIGLVVIPILFILFLALYVIYLGFTEPIK